MHNPDTSESMAPILIHSHIHRRRTGVSSSVSQILYQLYKFDYRLYTYGATLNEEVAQISVLKLLGLMWNRPPAIWHAHRNSEVMVALLFRWLNPRLRIVFTRHSATLPSWLTRLLMSSVDVVVALTQSAVSQLPAHAQVIPHGVDLKRYSYSALHEPRTIAIERSYLIGVIGRVRKPKGQHILLQAVAPLLREHKEWGVLILGRIKRSDKKYHRFLLRIIEAEEIMEQVYFVDEVSDTTAYYHACAVVAVPSLSEGFSMVTVEAMACGCEVIATRGVGIHDELIIDGASGRLVEKDNVGALRRGLLVAMTNIEAGNSLGYAASESVSHGWSTENEAQGLDALYRSLLSRKR